jgi:hypothetical protein
MGGTRKHKSKKQLTAKLKAAAAMKSSLATGDVNPETVALREIRHYRSPSPEYNSTPNESTSANRGVNPGTVALNDIRRYRSPSPKYDSMPKEVLSALATGVVNPGTVALNDIRRYRSPSPKYDSMPKEVVSTLATSVVNPGTDSTLKEDNPHLHECLRPNKRSHTETFATYGQCFQIMKPLSGSSVSCALHKKNISLGNVAFGETVQVVQCQVIDDQCYNELNLVVVEFLNRDGPVSHVPVDCININNPLKYKCFLCDNSDLGSDFDQAQSHLTECHKMTKNEDKLYIKCLKRMLLDQYLQRRFAVIRQMRKENDWFKSELEANTTDLALAIKEKMAEVEALKSEFQNARSSPPADNSHSPELPRSNNRSHTEALSIYGQCFQIKKPSSGSRVSCALHKNKIRFANLTVGQTVQVIRCKVSDDRCYNELNLVVVEFLNGDGPVTHVHVDCIDVNNPLKYQCFLCNNSELGSNFDQARSHLIECHKMTKNQDQSYLKRLKRVLLDQYPSRHEEIRKNDFAMLRQKMREEKDRFKTQLELALTDSEENNAEIEALKSELQKAHSSSPAVKTMTIKEEHAGDKEKEAELKLTICHLTTELNNAKSTINIEFEDKECKCSITKILNTDLEKKVEKLKDLLNLREKEIELINSE